MSWQHLLYLAWVAVTPFPVSASLQHSRQLCTYFVLIIIQHNKKFVCGFTGKTSICDLINSKQIYYTQNQQLEYVIQQFKAVTTKIRLVKSLKSFPQFLELRLSINILKIVLRWYFNGLFPKGILVNLTFFRTYTVNKFIGKHLLKLYSLKYEYPYSVHITQNINRMLYTKDRKIERGSVTTIFTFPKIFPKCFFFKLMLTTFKCPSNVYTRNCVAVITIHWLWYLARQKP